MEQYEEQTPCSGFVESSFGGATPAKSSHEQENRPLVAQAQQSPQPPLNRRLLSTVILALLQRSQRSHAVTPVETAFRMMDANGDGVVTRAEFQQAMQVRRERELARPYE